MTLVGECKRCSKVILGINKQNDTYFCEIVLPHCQLLILCLCFIMDNAEVLHVYFTLHHIVTISDGPHLDLESSYQLQPSSSGDVLGLSFFVSVLLALNLQPVSKRTFTYFYTRCNRENKLYF